MSSVNRRSTKLRKDMRCLAQAVINYMSQNYEIPGVALGRLSASEGFLRAYVQHGGADPLVCLSNRPSEIEAFQEYVARHAPAGVPSEWKCAS